MSRDNVTRYDNGALRKIMQAFVSQKKQKTKNKKLFNLILRETEVVKGFSALM